MSPIGYAELHCHSALSLLDGASLPESLAEQAAALGYAALALTDHDEMGGVVRFGTACQALALPGILGTELTVRMPELGGRGGERRTHLVLLAETRQGYRNIASLVTRARMDSDRGRPSVPWALVTRHVEGVTALTGCPRGWLPQLLAEGREDDAWTAACELRDVFGAHLAVECWDHRLPEERALVRPLRTLATRLGVPWVVTNDVHYATPDARLVHDVLLTLRHERTLDTMGTRLRPNAEWALKPIARIYQRWRGAEEGVRATLDIAARCGFRLQQLKPSMPAFPLPPGVTASEYLARLVEHGAHERWGKTRTPTHDRQLAHELGMIRKLDLAGYFLIVWDIVRFARREGILCQGRGSAANSAVCFCLGITAVDPIRMELLFERFLSEDRQEPPDIDIDFAHRDRERVLQYVYNRYGREHAAMVCEQITWRGRSAVRDAARVLGFSTEQADMLAALSDRFSARSTADALRVDEERGEAEREEGERDRTEATTKARVVRESARRVAATLARSSVSSPASVSSVSTRFSEPSSARPPKGITERDATWQQRIDLQAERKLASDERANLGPLAKGADHVRPGGRMRPKVDPSSRLPVEDEAPSKETHAEFVAGRNRATASRDGASGRELLQRAGLDPDDARVRQLAHVVNGLHQLPR
ncbi:PHP domain-containing protein, partial [Gemmatimonas sp.]|uniref:PHP domain-containing protein n=1 Tax=Gemmatimonas sp. TaxID=1962908 RepID=UPI0027B98870